MKGRIRGNTKIGPELDVAVTDHQGRYGIDIMTQSLSGDGTCSWVMIVNGINKYVTEMTEETQENHIDIGDSTVKRYDQRAWIDMEPGPFDKSCFEVSKKMIRLLRHDPSVLREEDGAVEFRILAQMFRSEFTPSQYWSI